MDHKRLAEQQPQTPSVARKSPRLSIREEHKQRTRDRLLDAAFEVFAKVGYRAATVDEIMKRAGANRATFYLHFTDKSDVAAGLGRRSATAVAERFRLLDRLAAPTPADVRAWFVEDLGERRRDKVLVHVTNEAITADPHFGQEYIDYFGRIATKVMVNTVARWPAEQQSRARSKLVCLLLMWHRVEFHVLCQDLKFSVGDPLDGLAEIFWNELFGCAVPAPNPAGTSQPD